VKKSAIPLFRFMPVPLLAADRLAQEARYSGRAAVNFAAAACWDLHKANRHCR
jgi:hypothetical protein